MKKNTPFFVYTVANSLVVYLCNLFNPDIFVVGHSLINYWVNIVFIGFLVTLILFLVKIIGTTPRSNFKGRGGGTIYWLFWNTFAFWLVAKLAIISGFGIPRFYWAFVIAFFASFAQWASRRLLIKYKFTK